MATPAWSAARSGTLGDTGAVDASAQINQLLGAHAITPVYQGAQILLPNGSGGGFILSSSPLNANDASQPFTMVGTTIGRVVLPVVPIGTGSDLIVSLCADSSGVPGTILNQTRIPASWISQLSAVNCVDVPGSPTTPVINPSGNPLAVAQFNSFRMGSIVTTPWPYPSVNNAGGAAAPASAYYGSYLLFVGGVDSNHNTLANVFTAVYDAVGNLAPAVPQSALPSVTDGSGKVIVGVDSVGGSPVIVQVGGGATFGGATTAIVYTAQLDASTGVVSSWSAQTSLPYTVNNQGIASYNGYVYIVGGFTTGTGTISSVTYGQIQNTQISSWTSTTPLPQAISLPYCAVSNGFLFVMGGLNQSSTALNTCYYAAINANGSLGPWQVGPSFYGTGFNLDSASFGNQYGIITQVSNVNYMAVTPNGPDITWNNDSSGTGLFTGYFEISPVSYRVYAASTFGNYGTYGMLLLPNISVPLPTTGLTNGTTYHILVQSPTNDGNNYLNFAHEAGTVFPGNPKILVRPKGSATWTASATTALSMTLYDGSATGPLWHLWDDAGKRITTVVRSTTPNQNVIGVLEATAQPGPVLNMNPTFTAGTSPWVAHGSAVVQSNAFTHGELPFSAKVTPDGVSALSYIESDQVSVLSGHTYTASVWLYSPTGYTPISLSINWYSAGVYNTTTSTGSLTIAAGVWTQYQFTSLVPSGLTTPTATIAPTESGTAPVTAIFYVSAATIQDASGPMLSSVNEVTYTGTWPSTTAWPPTGVNELA